MLIVMPLRERSTTRSIAQPAAAFVSGLATPRARCGLASRGREARRWIATVAEHSAGVADGGHALVAIDVLCQPPM